MFGQNPANTANNAEGEIIVFSLGGGARPLTSPRCGRREVAMSCVAPRGINKPSPFPACKGPGGALEVACPFCKREMRRRLFGTPIINPSRPKPPLPTNPHLAQPASAIDPRHFSGRTIGLMPAEKGRGPTVPQDPLSDPMRHLVRLGRAIVHKWLINCPSDLSPMREWSQYAIALLKDFYIQRATNFHQYALCVAGSLARCEATPFSDLDLFVIVSHPTVSLSLKLVGVELRRALKSTHEADWAMMLDPIGLEPVSMCDTPEKLLEFCQGRDIPGIFHSVRNSVCILGESNLLVRLKKLIEGANARPDWQFWLNDIKRAVTEFPRHQFKNETVIVKSDIGRPLWLVTNGLAKLHSITAEGTIQQATALLKANRISSQVWKLIVDSHKSFEFLRIHLHMKHRQEEEAILKATFDPRHYDMLMATLINVNCLQGMAEQFTCTSSMWSGLSTSKEFLSNNPIVFCKKS